MWMENLLFDMPDSTVSFKGFKSQAQFHLRKHKIKAVKHQSEKQTQLSRKVWGSQTQWHWLHICWGGALLTLQSCAVKRNLWRRSSEMLLSSVLNICLRHSVTHAHSADNIRDSQPDWNTVTWITFWGMLVFQLWMSLVTCTVCHSCQYLYQKTAQLKKSGLTLCRYKTGPAALVWKRHWWLLLRGLIIILMQLLKPTTTTTDITPAMSGFANVLKGCVELMTVDCIVHQKPLMFKELNFNVKKPALENGNYIPTHALSHR